MPPDQKERVPGVPASMAAIASFRLSADSTSPCTPPTTARIRLATSCTLGVRRTDRQTRLHGQLGELLDRQVGADHDLDVVRRRSGPGGAQLAWDPLVRVC